ncbi:LysR family transcriptional regulator [Kosakonia sacchari]|uniref:DNA-binding transcriptional regulator, LysR family n=1 Tax=Kosakonia sacchari TaxID=1158459 RepID=A0A1G4XDJ8_9ENTR|nr:LysR family transcriptional regulator [Kosakonia sacchari]AHJ74363.1 LysR family transcriptional regulator [Kosakonia sacchari SP1]SCX39259.1 DNA-binding transcriptional regulator, LysR family [Kosakonia sacchari]
MDINALKDFHLIAASGGIGAASRASGKPKATLSRRLTDLEEALGVRLIERGGQRLHITEAGERLLSRTVGAIRDIDEAVKSTREASENPSGWLRIAAPLLFSQLALGQLLAEFRRHYPRIYVEVIAENRMSDLVDEHFDVAIRINPHKNSALVGRQFARDKQVLVAVPTLEMPPGDAQNAPEIPALVMSTYSDGELWTVQGGQRRFAPQPVMRLSSLLTVRDATLAGAGAAMLPQSIVSQQLEKGELVCWGEADTLTELWVLHTSRRLQSPKVKAFVAFICEQYPSGWFAV